MKKVMAFGSFDVLHEGHKRYLGQAKSYGDHLIVVVARDSNILKFKGKPPRNNERFRLEQIKKIDIVDEAVLGSENNIFDVLEKYKPEVICLGYDQKTAEESILKKELEKRKIKAEIVRAKPYKEHIYKSSKLK